MSFLILSSYLHLYILLTICYNQQQRLPAWPRPTQPFFDIQFYGLSINLQCCNFASLLCYVYFFHKSLVF